MYSAPFTHRHSIKHLSFVERSMLYRFREAKAAELGVAGRGDKRPRMASACKSLRDCERWRGEILREISRKVSKIQDSQFSTVLVRHVSVELDADARVVHVVGLTDYEIRDLNDEINKLMREKRHWENQIIALGGANYRRNVAMLDNEGKEVPGTKGYKYESLRISSLKNLHTFTIDISVVPRTFRASRSCSTAAVSSLC
jgi:pre-mRNA-splicing factor ISY1